MDYNRFSGFEMHNNFATNYTNFHEPIAIELKSRRFATPTWLKALDTDYTD